MKTSMACGSACARPISLGRNVHDDLGMVKHITADERTGDRVAGMWQINVSATLKPGGVRDGGDRLEKARDSAYVTTLVSATSRTSNHSRVRKRIPPHEPAPAPATRHVFLLKVQF